MSVLVIKNAYTEYENEVNALIALTNEKDYEASERRTETIKFHKRALKELKEKIQSITHSAEFMVWAQLSGDAYRLFVYGEHYAKRISINSPMNDFEVLADACFKKLEYLTTAKCLELYSKW